MALLDGVLGNAAPIDPYQAERDFQRLLAPKEQVYRAYKLVRDVLLVTNLRLLMIDKQGITGKKIEYLSIPFKSITRFSVETAGHFDLDAELKVWVSGQPDPIEKSFSRGVDIYELQSILAEAVVR